MSEKKKPSEPHHDVEFTLKSMTTALPDWFAVFAYYETGKPDEFWEEPVVCWGVAVRSGKTWEKGIEHRHHAPDETWKDAAAPVGVIVRDRRLGIAEEVEGEKLLGYRGPGTTLDEWIQPHHRTQPAKPSQAQA